MNRRDILKLTIPGGILGFLPRLAVPKTSPPSQPELLMWHDLFHESAAIGKWLQTFMELQLPKLYFAPAPSRSEIGIAFLNPACAHSFAPLGGYGTGGGKYHGEVVAVRSLVPYHGKCQNIACLCHTIPDSNNMLFLVGLTDKSVRVDDAPFHFHTDLKPCMECGQRRPATFHHADDECPTGYLRCHDCLRHPRI